MKYTLFFSVLFFTSVVLGNRSNKHPFDKNSFYSALSSESINVINAQITELKSMAFPEKEAYEGVMLMKKAGVITGAPIEKLNLFKAGRLKLETAISKENNNTEYRFLRLIIQEHAPNILKYKSDIETDCKVIRANFKTLPDFVQKFIIDYSKSSKVLKIGA